MKKIYLILTIFCLNFLFAQNNIDDLLTQILENNQELIVLKQFNQLEKLNAKNELIPNNPEFEYSYKENGNYEAGITQSFQFPTYYYHQYKNMQLTKEQQKTIYQVAKMKVLEEAKIYISKLIFFEKQLKIQKIRLNNAEKLNHYFEKLLSEGEITQLTLNQSKLHRINYKNKLSDLSADKNEILNSLKLLNGNKKLDVSITDFPKLLKLANSNILQQEYLKNNPLLELEKINQEISNRNLKIAKYSWLPDFRLGVHTDKEKNTNLHYGISIPLWKNSNKINRAKVNQRYQEENLKYSKQIITSEIKNLFKTYLIMNEKYNKNLELNNTINSKALLEQSLKVQEISAIEYFNELETLFQFEDDFLKSRLGLDILETKLTSFRLIQ